MLNAAPNTLLTLEERCRTVGVLCALIDKADEICQRTQPAAITVEIKPDGSEVTSVDLAVSAAVQNGLAATLPEGVLHLDEELGTPPTLQDVMNARAVVVTDPIDGTAHFVAGRHDKVCNLFALWERDAATGRFVCTASVCSMPFMGRIVISYDTILSAQWVPEGAISGISPDSTLGSELVLQPDEQRMIADNGFFFEYNWLSKRKKPLIYSASGATQFDLLRGAGGATIFSAKWWDMGLINALKYAGYGAWPLVPVTADGHLTLGAIDVARMGIDPAGHFWDGNTGEWIDTRQRFLVCKPEQKAFFIENLRLRLPA